ncbi:MAG: hypothetical protein PVI49_11865 [Desulfobacterales bacterium]|jgi:hypothetical protein
MKILSQAFNSGRQNSKELNIVQTTLYDLIAAINKDVLPEEDWVVTNAVVDLFKTGQAKFLGTNYKSVI